MSRILVTIAALVMTAGTASAARLTYEMRPSDLACPSQSRFAEEVSAKLGFSPWTDDGLTMHVTIDLSTGRYTGHLAHDRDHEREFRADTCRRVADLLVTATAIALDRTDPVKPASSDRMYASGFYNTRVRVATADSPPARADELVLPANPGTEWAFEPHSNHFQLGAGMDSIAGTYMASGAVPLSRGHLDLELGHRSNSFETASSSETFVGALYMWPVFIINKNSSFEVPIYAGGGLAAFWTSVNGNTTTMSGTSQSTIVPELAISQSLQFRKFPVEFMFAMTLALADPPDGGSNFGVNLALRYVFRGR